MSWLGGPVSPVFQSSNVSSMLCQCVVHCVESSKSPSTKMRQILAPSWKGEGKPVCLFVFGYSFVNLVCVCIRLLVCQERLIFSLLVTS